MKQNDKQSLEKSFPHLTKLVSFILEQRLNLFVKSHFKKYSEYDALLLKDIPARRRQESLRMFRQSCENWLQILNTYSNFKSVQDSIEEAIERELLILGTGEFTIEYISTINFIWSESLKESIAEYTDDVNIALAIINEIDYFIATSNRIANQRYTQLLISNLEMENHTLRKSNENLNKLVGVVSYDLQPQLRKFSLYLDLIHRNVFSNNVYSYITKAKSVTVKMNVLIDNLLAFASALDDQKYEPKKCDLQKILEEVTENLEPEIKEKNARIIIDKLPTILADPFQMTQLFQNLLANALKFCKKDVTPIVQITNRIITKDNHTYLLIDIRDNCIGFKKEYSQNIFSFFTRLDSSYEGPGLGLAICKKIIENHAGLISVSSEEGEGTVFHIELPMKMNESESLTEP